ncbi:hypothetical protein MVEN_00027200 [Mycena venus]|uniref:Uncharacterized protein n=1 Tax=Mycena venus TaxID=2733690 RepID=A0A8H6Z6L8_9AGAR|nr:hypothetical protein MVEN_00027200 [Mycena venus]
MSSESPTPPGTPHNELVELTQLLTPRKSPGRVRQICLDIQARGNEAAEAHSAMKRKLVDVTNQLGNAPAPRKRRHRHARANEAPDDVVNPNTLEERVRLAGRHHAIEYGLYLHIDTAQLFATPLNPNFNEDTEFDTEESRIQGQLGDVILALPEDARDISIRKHEWLAKCFDDGLSGMLGSIHTRIRGNGLVNILKNVKFFEPSADPPEISVKLDDFDSSASRFNAFAARIGYQAATRDVDAFYSPLKAEIIYEKYNGTPDVDKVFRGAAPLSIAASILRGPSGPKGLLKGESKLPCANCFQRKYRIKHTTPGLIVNSNVLAIWLFSADTTLVATGDQTNIDYHLLSVTFMRQISEGLRDGADWTKELFRYWDGLLFPNADDSLGELPSANRRAVRAEVEAMDALFKAATASRASPRALSPSRTPPHQCHQPRSPTPPPLALRSHQVLPSRRVRRSHLRPLALSPALKTLAAAEDAPRDVGDRFLVNVYRLQACMRSIAK